MKKIIYILVAYILFIGSSFAQEYNASKFGCVSDGITNNTTSIQYAIDFISAKGGGKLNFYVGRYLTGSLELKSNVTIELHEGAVFLASPNLNDYTAIKDKHAVLVADNITNFKLIGKGVIEYQLDASLDQFQKINESGQLSYSQDQLPAALLLVDSKNIQIDGILFSKLANQAIKIEGGENIQLQNLVIKSSATLGAGLAINNGRDIALQNIYVDVKNQPFQKLGNTTIVQAEKCITPNGKSIL